MTPRSSKTYSVILRGDRLEWLGEAPNESLGDQPLRLEVKVVDGLRADDQAALDPAERRRRIGEALRALAARGTFSEINDPVAWQREIRADRPLPGRES